ncbi:MAG: Gfo/Idh/MocA family oxidoreductase [Acidimicrobiia bacterium]|nr:Gfo/Idh/MocA family oxidoreductase [Acidimicrobiia bacterium]
MRVAVLGAGAVGARTCRQLVTGEVVTELVVREHRAGRRSDVVTSLGEPARADEADYDAPLDVDAVVVTGPAGTQAPLARTFLRRGLPVVTTADGVEDMRALLALDAEARERGITVVAGAGMAPGLTDVLAALGARRLTAVDEVHVSKCGTAGPACAREHHRALGGHSVDWRDGGWSERPGGSGRELHWFPDPVGAKDCYRGALPDALTLVPTFPGVARVTARMAATRRDRLTARLPMLRRPHPEAGPGAVRVELRGTVGEGRAVVVFGAMDRPSVAAGAVAAQAVEWLLAGRMNRSGVAGLGELVAPGPFLAELAARGVRCAIFEGDGADPLPQPSPAGK